MIFDFLDSDTSERDFHADVCIIGGGAAGISLALGLKKSGKRIIVIESGGLDYDDETQTLAAGDIIGRSYFEIMHSRLRMLGGSTNHWQGECSRFDAIDFLKRPWVPHSGWPITFTDLQPWYLKAQSLMKLGDFDDELLRIKNNEVEPLAFDQNRVRPKLWKHSDPPLLFGVEFLSQLKSAKNIDVYLHGNHVGFEMEEDAQRVSCTRIASLKGHRARIYADIFVLATGGLENPRILLNSERDVGRALGNSNDLVGRYFMDHINFVGAELIPSGDDWHRRYQPFVVDGHTINNRITLSPEQQKVEQVLNSAVSLESREFSRSSSQGYGSLHKIKQDLIRGQVPDRLSHHISRILSDLPGTMSAIMERNHDSVWVAIEGEQAPNPSSRVVLGDDYDQLGMRKILLDWRLSDIDIKTTQRLLNNLGHELGRLGRGRLRLLSVASESDQRDPQSEISGGFHHMGTTRMASSPKDGVVDANAKVFDTKNLYVAGSSLFPTGGCANPTLTIVSLALRLANHLQERVL